MGTDFVLATQDASRRFSKPPTGMSFISGAAPKTRRATICLGGAETTTAAAAIDYVLRTVIVAPTVTTRFRFLIRNANARLNTSLTTPCTITGVWSGTPVLASSGSYRWTGDYTATPTQIVSSPLTVPTDGTDVASPWISTNQFGPTSQVMLSFGITSTNSGTGYATGSSLQMCGTGTTGSTHAGDTAISGLSGFFAPRGFSVLDIRIECEFVGTMPIGIFTGDSITAGTSDGDTGKTHYGTLVHESWPGVAGMLGGFWPINMGIPSGKVETFATGTHAITRVDLASCVPDFAVMATGTNNIGSALSTYQGLYRTAMNLLRALGINRLYLANLLPRVDAAAFAGTLAADSAAGATSISSTISVASGTSITIGFGRKRETVTTSGSPTGAGPYSLPVPALTFAHTTGDYVITSLEQSRQLFNDWVMQAPNGAVACLDFDTVMSTAQGNPNPDPRVMSTDLLHPLRAGYQRMGQQAAHLGRILPAA